MKAFVCAICATAIIVALSSFPAFAQESSSGTVLGVVQNGNRTIIFERSNANLNLDQLSAFGQLTASDPALANKLARNPSLVNDEGLVRRNPALQQYFENYPNAREDIAANPGNYLTPVNGSSWSRAPAGMQG
jgi:hypothetical protein